MDNEESKKNLHVFELGDTEEWVVAHDVEDAWVVLLEFYGDGSHSRADSEANGGTFERCPDDRVLSILCDAAGKLSDGGKGIKRTCEEWAQREGRGYLCSGNY